MEWFKLTFIYRDRHGRTVKFMCYQRSGGELSLSIDVMLLKQFSKEFASAIREFSQGVGGNDALKGITIPLPHVSNEVARRCVEYLKGEPLLIKLPSLHASNEAKKYLLEFCHFAHILGIQPLMNAAMHALCTHICRSQKDWEDDDVNAQLLEGFTFDGNPARTYLKPPTSVVPGVTGEKGLLCDKDEVLRVCKIDEDSVASLWREKRKMKAILPSAKQVAADEDAFSSQSIGVEEDDSAGDAPVATLPTIQQEPAPRQLATEAPPPSSQHPIQVDVDGEFRQAGGVKAVHESLPSKPADPPASAWRAPSDYRSIHSQPDLELSAISWTNALSRVSIKDNKFVLQYKKAGVLPR